MADPTLNGLNLGKLQTIGNEKNANIVPLPIPTEDSNETEVFDMLGVVRTIALGGVFVGTLAVADSGTTTGTTADKLVDSGQNFTSTVSVGDIVKNTTDTTYASVTAVSDTQLSLSADIMVSGEAYEVGGLPNKVEAIESLCDGSQDEVVTLATDEIGSYTVMVASISTNWDVAGISNRCTYRIICIQGKAVS